MFIGHLSVLPGEMSVLKKVGEKSWSEGELDSEPAKHPHKAEKLQSSRSEGRGVSVPPLLSPKRWHSPYERKRISS